MSGVPARRLRPSARRLRPSARRLAHLAPDSRPGQLAWRVTHGALRGLRTAAVSVHGLDCFAHGIWLLGVIVQRVSPTGVYAQAILKNTNVCVLMNESTVRY